METKQIHHCTSFLFTKPQDGENPTHALSSLGEFQSYCLFQCYCLKPCACCCNLSVINTIKSRPRLNTQLFPCMENTCNKLTECFGQHADSGFSVRVDK